MQGRRRTTGQQKAVHGKDAHNEDVWGYSNKAIMAETGLKQGCPTHSQTQLQAKSNFSILAYQTFLIELRALFLQKVLLLRYAALQRHIVTTRKTSGGSTNICATGLSPTPSPGRHGIRAV